MLEALIPYIVAPEKTLVENLPLIGPLKLQLFGPMVIIGIWLGWKQSCRYAATKDIDETVFTDYLWWMALTAFVVSHWVSLLFYFPEQVRANPWSLLAIFSGLSSVGGFFGAFLGMTFFLKKRKQPVIVYADATVFGLLLGWCFGRFGCTLVHDHPGRIVDSSAFLAVGPWPDGTWRYDLGFLEFLFSVALCAFVYLLVDWKSKRPGWLVGFAVSLYAPFRFGIDFLRAQDTNIGPPDPRYAGLTTAQWFTIAFFMAGIYLLFFRKPKPRDFEYAKDSDRVARQTHRDGDEEVAGAERSPMISDPTDDPPSPTSP